MFQKLPHNLRLVFKSCFMGVLLNKTKLLNYGTTWNSLFLKFSKIGTFFPLPSAEPLTQVGINASPLPCVNSY